MAGYELSHCACRILVWAKCLVTNVAMAQSIWSDLDNNYREGAPTLFSPLVERHSQMRFLPLRKLFSTKEKYVKMSHKRKGGAILNMRDYILRNVATLYQKL